jgi:ribosomal protein S18 acetylase RimI-like enzyme
VILDSAPPLDVVRELFEEYASQIGVDLRVQNFAAELAGLPANYNVILVARDQNGSAAGCVGVRAFRGEAKTAELKRLYVRQAYRGIGLGRQLTEAAMREAAARGYEWLRLDTLGTMTAAIAMYRAMGFEETGPIGVADFAGQLFFRIRVSCEAQLRQSSDR